jgi:hypothetical protein
MCIPLSLLCNGSEKSYRGKEYTRNNVRIVKRVISYAVRVVSKKLCYYLFPEVLVLLYSAPNNGSVSKYKRLKLGGGQAYDRSSD